MDMNFICIAQNNSIMISKLIPIVMIIPLSSVSGQNVLLGNGARNEGLARTCALANDEWSLWRNPAGLKSLSSLSLAFSARQPQWMPASNQLAMVVMPIRSTALSAGVGRFGDDIYNEHLVSLGAAHQVGITSVGLRADMFQLHIEGEDIRRTVGISLGVITDITPRLKLGASARNINLPSWAEGQPLPVLINAGLMYTPTPSFSFIAEIEKNTGHDPTIKAALEYSMRDKFFARTGYNLFPNAAFAGLGMRTWKLGFDYALCFGSPPGNAHVLSVSFRTKHKSKSE
jgi:hypothetical protein